MSKQIIQISNLSLIKDLTNEQAGIVAKNICNYAAGGKLLEMGTIEQLVFNSIKPKIKREIETKCDFRLIQEAFAYWWDLYPVSRRKNKGGCFDKFKRKCSKLDESQLEDLTNKIAADIKKRVATISDLKYMPMTEPYLNQERWNDGE